jgi:hypothetical protein
MDDGFLDAAGRMSEDEFLGRYGPRDPMAPAEVAAELDRDKDRADLAAARLSDEGRAWLAKALDRLGYAEWAALLR